jgi:hypothetical protein
VTGQWDDGAWVSVPYLTDDEEEFLTAWQRGIGGALGLEATAVDEAAAAARAAVAAMTERWPSRTQRLAVLAALAAECHTARDQLLDEVLDSRYRWRNVADAGEPGDWRALAWQPWEERGLSKLSGLSPTTIARRIRAATRRTLDAAKAAEPERTELGQ